MKSTLFLASIFAVSGLCSPIDDQKVPHKNLKSSNPGAGFANLHISADMAPISNLCSGDRLLEEIKGTGGKQVKITDMTAKKWKAKVQKACHDKPECVGYWVGWADDDGTTTPDQKIQKWRFGYTFKGKTLTRKDFEKGSSSSGLKKSSSSGLKKSSSSGLKESSSFDENGTSTSGGGEAFPYPNVRGAVAYKKKTTKSNSNSN